MTKIKTVSGQGFVVRENFDLACNLVRSAHQQLDVVQFTLEDGNPLALLAMNVEAVWPNE